MKSESIICQELISCCRFLESGLIDGIDPVEELELLIHIPNEGNRTDYERGKLHREGLKRGVSDYSLPIRSYCGKYSSLFIEMKRENGVESIHQKNYRELLTKFGNKAVVRRSSKSALRTIMIHLGRFDVVDVIDNDFDRIRNPI